eukprot:2551249-Prymnesium_polylepis.1
MKHVTRPEEHLKSGRFVEVGKCTLTGIVQASGEFLSAGVGLDTEVVVDASGRMLMLGWAFFVLITISSCECRRSNPFGWPIPVRLDRPFCCLTVCWLGRVCDRHSQSCGALNIVL